MFASKALLYTEMESVNDSAGEIASSEKYNSPDDSKLSASVKKQKEAYCKEIGTTVNKYTVFLKEYDDASKNPDKFIKAADAIRDKLNSTKTPAVCTLDREIMLICCDLLEQAGNDVKTGALEDDGKNEKYIEFTYSLAAFEQLVKDVLGDNYELKFIEESDDEEKSEEEKKIEENIEGKYV